MMMDTTLEPQLDLEMEIDPERALCLALHGSVVQGPPGKSAYEVWLAEGNTGSAADFLTAIRGVIGTNGREVELSVDDTNIYWQYTGDTTPQILMPRSALKGDDGRSAEFRRTAVAVQWRQAGGVWTDLIPLDLITGERGLDGASGQLLHFTAGVALDAFQGVYVENGLAYPASRDSLDTAERCIGITEAAAAQGSPVAVRIAGLLAWPTAVWTPGPLYLGVSGELTQTMPEGSGVVYLSVGTALDGAAVNVRLSTPIELI